MEWNGKLSRKRQSERGEEKSDRCPGLSVKSLQDVVTRYGYKIGCGMHNSEGASQSSPLGHVENRVQVLSVRQTDCVGKYLPTWTEIKPRDRRGTA